MKYRVIKSLTRGYGYAIQSLVPQSHITGPANSFGWYRLKPDAQKRADELTRCEEIRP